MNEIIDPKNINASDSGFYHWQRKRKPFAAH